jgi:hypothetical protein
MRESNHAWLFLGLLFSALHLIYIDFAQPWAGSGTCAYIAQAFSPRETTSGDDKLTVSGIATERHEDT